MQTKAKRRAGFEPIWQPRAIAEAIGHLKDARWLLRNCGSKKAADYVSRAIKSAEGARNHARRMMPDTGAIYARLSGAKPV